MPRRLLLLLAVTLVPAAAQNRLVNPGFEDPAGWRQGWTVTNTRGAAAPYVYPLGPTGGGHARTGPHEGQRAVELYSSDRVTRLAQPVTLTPGRWRLACWAANHGATIEPALRFGLGEQVVQRPVASDRYRRYYADFTVPAAGACDLWLESVTLGVAVDDLTLAPAPPPAADGAPYLYFDLAPTGGSRSDNVQPFFPGEPQWVDYTLSCTDPTRLGPAWLELAAPEGVTVEGINAELLRRWGVAKRDPSVSVEPRTEQGRPVTVTRFALPRFVSGPAAPLALGGFFVEPAEGRPAALTARLVDERGVVSQEVIQLLPVEPPAGLRAPKRLKTVAYAVQDWKADPELRRRTLPTLFRRAGYNVWSDYGLTPADASAAPSAEEAVRKAAWRAGVPAFWPNFSSLLETSAGNHYADATAGRDEPGMLQVSAEGKVNRGLFRLRYAAEKGAAWMASAVAAHQRTLRRMAEQGLPMDTAGFITDALEGLPVSYDRPTLDAFAKDQGLAPAQVTVDAVRGPLSAPWRTYLAGLYARVAANLAEACREVAPGLTMVNTAGSFGPGGTGDLPLEAQMRWAKAYQVTMPQWYGPLGFYGSAFLDDLRRGLAAQVYGAANGYADVIPLLNLSMGTGLETPENLRFRLFDMVSASPVVRGVGYYIASHGFADAKLIAGLGRNHDLLAQVEDAYLDGRREDAAATFTPDPTPLPPIAGLDADGQPTTVTPVVNTEVRVHRRDDPAMPVVLTVLSHSNQGVGQAGTLTLDPAKLGLEPARYRVRDLLTGRMAPWAATLPIDTTATANLALLAVVRR